jgi:hypothetical protein
MTNLSTATGGPTYIANSPPARTPGAALEDRNYVSGVIGHEFERIRETISRSLKAVNPEPLSAPRFQLTPGARYEMQRFTSSLEAQVGMDPVAKAPQIRPLQLPYWVAGIWYKPDINPRSQKFSRMGLLAGTGRTALYMQRLILKRTASTFGR